MSDRLLRTVMRPAALSTPAGYSPTCYSGPARCIHPCPVSPRPGLQAPAAFTGVQWVLLSFALALGPITLLLHPSPQDAVNWPVIVFGVALIILVLARMGAVVRSRERAISRERILRDAGTELVRAPDRERIYAATLEAILPFIKEAPGTRVSVWSGSPEKDRCVAARRTPGGRRPRKRDLYQRLPRLAPRIPSGR